MDKLKDKWSKGLEKMSELKDTAKEKMEQYQIKEKMEQYKDHYKEKVGALKVTNDNLIL
jgi:hypothetical protein